MSRLRQLPAFFLSPAHACGYLPGREAVTLFADPHATPSPELYAHLARFGFRRSGEHLYRPRCPDCTACVPVRVPVHGFAANRSQRRNARANATLEPALQPFGFDPEQFALYRRYMAWRHPGSSMDDADPGHYLACFASSWCDTAALTLRADGRLVAVAVTDRLGDAWSAVYTYFDPALAARGLGTHAVLRQLEGARQAGCSHLYLGYWIAACAKMRYKAGFRPLEWFSDGHWLRLAPGAPLPG
ncbi:MAG TPA: arginyltransferase [Gammaproteobacteria bacterium]